MTANLILTFIFAIFIIGVPVGSLMALAEILSGGRIKFFGLKYGEPIYDKYRRYKW